MPLEWIKVCPTEEIDEEDAIRYDYGDISLAVRCLLCNRRVLYTHEHVHLSGGLVMGCIIECPKHNS